MQLKIRKENKDGLVKVESSGEVKEIMIKEDLASANGETIAVCFRGTHSSGIIEFTAKEIDMILKVANQNMHLIKHVRKGKI
jgi:galactose-1-phosphate uridylyltransferase